MGVNKDFEDAISTLKKGEVSQPVVLTGNTKIALAVCTGDIPPHPAGFDEVQNKVRDALIKDKLNKLVDQKANELMTKARANGGDLEAAAKSMGLEAKTSDAVDHAGAIEGLGSAGMFPGRIHQARGLADRSQRPRRRFQGGLQGGGEDTRRYGRPRRPARRHSRPDQEPEGPRPQLFL